LNTFLLILVLASIPGQSRAYAQSDTLKSRHHSKQVGSSSPKTATDNIGQPGTDTPPSPETDKNQTNYYQAPAESKSNWVPIAVSALSLIVSVIALLVVIKQARIFSNAERPWILGDIQQFVIQPNPLPGRLRVVCDMRNHGKSPAWLGKRTVGKMLLNPLENIPVEPVYPPALAEHDEVLVSKNHIPALIELSAQENNLIATGEKVLYIFGFVEYKGGLGDFHKTRFCYQYTPPAYPGSPTFGFFAFGGAAYNEHT
jgi:hypothetical protein